MQFAQWVRRGQGAEREARSHLERFALRMAEALQTPVPLVLDLDPDEGFHVDGQPVLQGDRLSRSLVQALHQQGLRAVSFEPATDLAQLRAVGHLLSIDWARRSHFESDLESMAWNAGFSDVHIEIDLGSQLSEMETAAFGTLVEGLTGQGLQADGTPSEPGLRRLLEELRAVDQVPAPPLGLPPGQHRGTLGRELEAVRVDKDVGVDQVGRLLAESLRLQKDALAVGDVARKLVTLVLRTLAEGQPEEAGVLLHRPIGLLHGDQYPDFPHREVLYNELRVLLGPGLAEAVTAGLKLRPVPQGWVGVLFTVGQLARRAELPGLCRMGTALGERALQQAVADALLLVMAREGLGLGTLLERATDAEVVPVLLAYARRPDPTQLERVLGREHSDAPAVREAVLVAVRNQQSPRVKTLVRLALDDEASGVRVEALRYACVYKDGSIVPWLRQRLDGADSSLPDSELGALCRAWALLRKEEPGFLSGLVGRHKFNPDDPLVRAALAGLSGMGSEGRQLADSLGREHPGLRDCIRDVRTGGSA